jgi:hypothetical protein
MVDAWRTGAENNEHAMKTRDWNVARAIVLLAIAVFSSGAAGQEAEEKSVKKDRRVPRLAQWVARAPNYTMKVDEFSGVGTYLFV